MCFACALVRLLGIDLTMLFCSMFCVDMSHIDRFVYVW